MTHTLKIMGTEGDKQYAWSTTEKDSVALAEQVFTERIGKGYAAFRIDSGGSGGEQIRAFDPEAENIIMMQQLAGG